MDKMRSRDLLLGIVIALAGTLLFTAPWKPNSVTMPNTYAGKSQILAQHDAGLWAFMLAWGARHPNDLFGAPILVPLSNPMVANDPRLTENLWTIPLFRIADPITALGYAIWIALAVTAFTAYLSGLAITGSPWGGATLAVLWGFGAFRANHICHIEGLFAPFLPLVPAALVRFLDHPSRNKALLCGAVACLAAIEYSYTAVMLGLTIPVILVAAAYRRGIAWKRIALLLVAMLLPTALILAPVAATYYRFHSETQMGRNIREIDSGGADLEAWLTGPDGRVIPPFGDEAHEFFDLHLFPGVMMLSLAVAGLPELRRRWPEIILWGGVMAFLTFGTMRHLFWSLGLSYFDTPTPYEMLYDWLLPLRAIRSPGRFVVGVDLVLAVAAALAVTRIIRTHRRAPILMASLLILGFCESRLSMREVPIRPERSGDPAYAWIARQPGNQAVLDAPMGFTSLREHDLSEVDALAAALEHQAPTPNGVMAIPIPWHLSIQQHTARPRPTETPRILRALGVRFVVARDSITADTFERVGLKVVFRSPRGSRVLEVDSPEAVPGNPAELQERLFDFPHSRHLIEKGPTPCRIETPRSVLVKKGNSLIIPATVTNLGTETWCAGSAIFGGGPRGDIVARIRLWEGLGEGTDPRPRGLRGEDLLGVGYLPTDLAPGETCILYVRGRPPLKPGLYRAWIDLCAVEIEWFHRDGIYGSPVLVEVAR